MKPTNKRYRLLADWRLQGMFCVRVCAYWLVCQIALVATIFGFLALEGQQDVEAVASGSPWRFILPAIVASSLFLPVVLLDCLKFSNRFCGPLLRLGNSMKKLGKGEDVSDIQFRPGDYLTDLAGHFNAINSRSTRGKEKTNGQNDDDDSHMSNDHVSSAACSQYESIK